MSMKMQGRCEHITKSEQGSELCCDVYSFHVWSAAISEQDSQGGDGFSVPSVILIAASLEVLNRFALISGYVAVRKIRVGGPSD